MKKGLSEEAVQGIFGLFEYEWGVSRAVFLDLPKDVQERLIAAGMINVDAL